jgi:TolB protein
LGGAQGQTVSLINANGTGDTTIWLPDGVSSSPISPALAPDGRRIAYASLQSQQFDIWTMSAFGENATKIASRAGPSLEWSPDGTRIAYLSAEPVTNEQGSFLKTLIAVVGANGSGARTVTNDPNYLDMSPAWSPDGRWIAFSRTHALTGDAGIWLVQPDRPNLAPQPIPIQPQLVLEDPAWSPDGKYIAYCGGSPGHEDIFVTDPDGRLVTQLTNHPARDTDPIWSPDGKYIAFSSERDFYPEIYVMRADGSHQTRLTHSAEGAGALYPDWAPSATAADQRQNTQKTGAGG